MREARNNRIVLDQIRVRTGIQVRIISNSEQRFLGYKAIAVSMMSLMRISSRGPRSWMWDLKHADLADKNLLATTENLPLGVLRDPRHSSGRQYDGGVPISSERWWTMSWKTIKRCT